jgi:NAD(P)-dependent dehydrogenase (short-subunit alcohol dehydrogenase family)
MRLKDKTAIVTGAASGLGAGIAQGYIDEGAVVLLTDINEEKGQAVADSLGEKATFMRHDVTSEGDWEKVMAHFDQLDILVNNAGITSLGNIEQVTVESYRQMYDIDVLGVLLGCRFAIEKMKDGGPGSIINISSSTAVLNEPELAVYCSAKAAVLSINKTTALHCANNKYGIRCNAILPGIIQTEMLDFALSQVPEDQREAAMQRWSDKFPIGRIGKVAEINAAAVYLGSEEESGFTTGLEMLVDGGAAI